MELILGLLMLALVAGAVIGFGWLICFWIYWWCSGMIDIMYAWIGLPGWVTIMIAIIIALAVRPGMLILAVVGLFGWVFTLHNSWFTGLLVYMPTIAIMFVTAITTIAIGILALIVQTWDNVTRRR